MPVGRSDRIVVTIDLDVKRRLYAVLAREGKTLKEWFRKQVEDYLKPRSDQVPLPLEDEDS